MEEVALMALPREDTNDSEATLGSNEGNIELSDQANETGHCPRTEMGLCPNPYCGMVFKDLKAHMLTHQSERPEKCPILACEYNSTGFARKWDKNRHTLTHYKGVMICGFCSESGTVAEKSFIRVDVFKRHLVSVHNVEQTSFNNREKSSFIASIEKSPNISHDAMSKCSTCFAIFHDAQNFYEHLDDCVLRVIQRDEAIVEELLLKERLLKEHLII